MSRYAAVTYELEVIEIDAGTDLVIAVHGPYESYEEAQRIMRSIEENTDHPDDPFSFRCPDETHLSPP